METKISVPDLQSLQIFYISLNLCEPTVIHFQPLAHSCLQICFATEQISSFNSTRSI